ncbi:MAG: GNAT family N-acetyltransferase [Firmicutes bacterium]|nr:GNAT family N-acetyltransferase [Bacillota bacterium]
MLVDCDINIRPMKEDEKDKVSAAMHRSFSLIERWSFYFTPDVLIGERDGEVLGAIVLKTFEISQNSKGGLIAWVFTVPEARGLGLGQTLSEAGIDFLEKQGCKEIFAAVEGHNTSSAKLFASRGFGILSPGQQFHRYGVKVLKLWLKTSHLIDVGHFLWMKPAPEQKAKPSLQLWGTMLLTCLVWPLLLWRMAGGINPMRWLGLSIAAIILFGIRYAAMILTARRQGLQVRYRAWESGFPLSIAVAVVLGGTYLIPGNVYPSGHDWRYKDLLLKLSRMALYAILSVLIITILAGASVHFKLIHPALTVFFRSIFHVGTALLLVDTCLVFLKCYNGRRIWDWSKSVWLILTIIIISLLYIF